MTNRESTLEERHRLVGLSQEEAERRMQDEDPWLLIPEKRFGLDGEEAVEQWHEARAWALWMADGTVPGRPLQRGHYAARLGHGRQGRGGPAPRRGARPGSRDGQSRSTVRSGPGYPPGASALFPSRPTREEHGVTQDHRMGVGPGKATGLVAALERLADTMAEGRSWMNAEECAAFLSMNRDEFGKIAQAMPRHSLPPKQPGTVSRRYRYSRLSSPSGCSSADRPGRGRHQAGH